MPIQGITIDDPDGVAKKISAAEMDAALKSTLEILGADYANRMAGRITAMGQHDPLTSYTSSMPGQPPQMASGKLRDSIRPSAARRLSPQNYEILIGPGGAGPGPVGPRGGVSYAFTQEYGATIRPVSAKALVFISGGRKYMLGQVTVKPHPFVQPTANEVDTRIVSDFVKAFFSELSHTWIGN